VPTGAKILPLRQLSVKQHESSNLGWAFDPMERGIGNCRELFAKAFGTRIDSLSPSRRCARPGSLLDDALFRSWTAAEGTCRSASGLPMIAGTPSRLSVPQRLPYLLRQRRRRERLLDERHVLFQRPAAAIWLSVYPDMYSTRTAGRSSCTVFANSTR
jgi:hypothetical protein